MRDYKHYVTPEPADMKDPYSGDPILDGGTADRYEKAEDGKMYMVERGERGEPVGEITLLDWLHIWVFRRKGWEKGIKKQRAKREWDHALRGKEAGQPFRVPKGSVQEVVKFLESDDYVLTEPWGTCTGHFADFIIDEGASKPQVTDTDAEEEATG